MYNYIWNLLGIISPKQKKDRTTKFYMQYQVSVHMSISGFSEIGNWKWDIENQEWNQKYMSQI